VNHWQVWLLYALPLFLVWFIGWWVIDGKPLVGLVLGSISALAGGAFQSHRLGDRRDAAATAEWASGRRLPPPGR
jgi:hypothetical protein